jgi:hypothetical protein
MPKYNDKREGPQLEEVKVVIELEPLLSIVRDSYYNRNSTQPSFYSKAEFDARTIEDKVGHFLRALDLHGTWSVRIDKTFEEGE